jgi:hypothetical protein
MCALADWWWLESYEILRFDAPVTANDFDCVLGTADIVPSASADLITTAYKFGWAYTGEHLYRVLDIEASSPWTITLDANFIETSSAYSVTFWNDTLTLSTAFDHSVSVAPRKDPNYKPLRHVDLAEIEKYGPDLSTYEEDVAREYAIYREDTIVSNRFRMRIFPPPDTTAEYFLRYIMTPADMANDTASALVPVKHESVLADMARLELMKVTGADPGEIAVWEGETTKGIGRMGMEQNKKGNMQRSFGRRGGRETTILPYKLTNYTVGDPI